MSLVGFGFCNTEKYSSLSLKQKQVKLASATGVYKKVKYHEADLQNDHLLLQEVAREGICVSNREQVGILQGQIKELQQTVTALISRDHLAEVVSRFNDLVVAGMAPYFAPGTCASTFIAFHYRRTTDEAGRHAFDLTYLEVAAKLLQVEQSDAFVDQMRALRSYEAARSTSVHELCSQREAADALETMLKSEVFEAERKCFGMAFSLVINTVCAVDVDPELSYTPGFKLPAPLRADAYKRAVKPNALDATGLMFTPPPDRHNSKLSEVSC